MMQNNKKSFVKTQIEEEQGQLSEILDAPSPTSSKEMSSDEEGVKQSPSQDQLHSLVDSQGASPVQEDEESVEEKAEEKVAEAASGAELGGAVDTTRFPWKLHRMLTEIEEKNVGLEDIISWQPHGRCKCQ